MLPKLMAEQRLQSISDTAVGTASVAKDDAEKHMRRLNKQTGAKRQRARKPTPADLSALGFTMHKKDTPPDE